MAAANSRSRWRLYPAYLGVSAFVGVLTIAAREALGWMLGRDNPGSYALTVVLAYLFGTVLNYALQGIITFRQPASTRMLVRFAAVSIVGLLLTTALALALRYGLAFDSLFGTFGPAAAFAGGALLASAITFSVNARLVFASRAEAAGAGEPGDAPSAGRMR